MIYWIKWQTRVMHRSFCVLKDIKSIITRSFLDRKRSHKIFRFRRAEGSKSRFLRGKCRQTVRKPQGKPPPDIVESWSYL